MIKVQTVLKNAALYTLSLMLIAMAPTAAFADEPETYTYDAHSGRWNSNKWIYDPATNVYVPAPPEKITTTSSNEPDQAATENQEQTDGTANAASPAGTSTVDATVDASSDTTINNENNVLNDIDSDSESGDATVESNTQAGGAGTGNADVNATIVNSIHSTVDGETTGIAHFTTNIYGDVVGDITIGPNIQNAQVNRDIDINNEADIDNSGSITNDVELTAKSGDAEVSKNTKAGSAKTGNANVVANVLNFINTVISANKSFVGTINIYGNLNGDILVSPEFIPQLLASNAVETTEIDLAYGLNLDNEQNIINNVDLKAMTGDATVEGNTKAGTAKTGNAQTKLTVLNLTGRKVDAKNSLLVFVNVLGKWIGMIVDAPDATAAAFGSGVSSNTTVDVSDQTNISNKSKIVNNLDLSAESGDASVIGNTQAGDAESGNATASANIANIDTTVFQVSDWFGILFINVFGTWIGSFGIDTSAGTVTQVVNRERSVPLNPNAPNIHFGFVPGSLGGTNKSVHQDVPNDTKTQGHKDEKEKNDENQAQASGVVGGDSGGASGTGIGLAAVPLAMAGLLGGSYVGLLGFRRWQDFKAPLS